MPDCQTLEFLPEVRPTVRTAAITQDALCTSERPVSRGGSGWIRAMATLDTWENDPDRFEVAETIPPSQCAIGVARSVAAWLRGQGFAAPSRIVPDADGGLALERSDGDESITIHVHDDGSVEWLQFLRCALVYRQLLPPLPARN